MSPRILPRALPPAGIDFTLGDLTSALVRGRRSAVAAFGESLCRRFQAPHAFFASSGRAALVHLLCAMADLRPGRDEVLLPAYTSFSVPSAVVRAGFRVALYDLDPQTLEPDLESLEQGINRGTLCVLAAHLYGYPADLSPVEAMASRSGVFLIDDAAQALGATIHGRPAGGFGDAGLLSFSRGKPLTLVEGGAVMTRSASLAAALSRRTPQAGPRAETLRLFGRGVLFRLFSRPSLYWLPQHLPMLNLGRSVFDPTFALRRFTGFQGMLGNRALKRLEAVNAYRRQSARSWIDALEESGAEFPLVPEGSEPIFLRLPVLNGREFPSRPELGFVDSYPAPLHRLDVLRPHLTPAAKEGEFSGAAALAAIRTLPTHRFVAAEDMARLKELFGRKVQRPPMQSAAQGRTGAVLKERAR